MVVIDPGTWSEPYALHGADAVLVTHEHRDYIDVLRLAGLGVPVCAPADARITGLDVIGVQSGESFTEAGFAVTAGRGTEEGLGVEARCRALVSAGKPAEASGAGRRDQRWWCR